MSESSAIVWWMKQGTGEATIDRGGDWTMIRNQLPENYRELALEHSLIKPDLPSALGSNVTDIDPILRLIFYHVATHSGLRQTTAMGVAAGLITLSAVALHKWMKKIGPYIADVLAELITAKSLFSAERWAGYDIQVVDATTAQRPGANGTTARVHYALRLTTAQPSQIQVTSDKGGETFRRFDAQQGQLWMGDRAYANPPGIAWMCDQGADVLVRYNRGSLPLYDKNGDEIDIFQKFSRLQKPNQVREWAAWVYPKTHEPIRGRLCIVRLPTDKANQARERVHKELGTKATPEALRAADYVTVFTTVPRERLSKDLVIDLYRIRWQIELYIKRDKSIAGLDRLPNFREDTIFTWLCTKLLLTQITLKIASPEVVSANSLSPKLLNPDRNWMPAFVLEGHELGASAAS